MSSSSPYPFERISTASDAGELVPRFRPTTIGSLGALTAKAASRAMPWYSRRIRDSQAPPPWESNMTGHLRGDSLMVVPKGGPTGRDRILQIPECRAFANNDGSVTYAVHGTSVVAANQIAVSGLNVVPRRRVGSGEVSMYPELGITCIPLDGPGWDQLAANVDKLAFRFYGKPGSHEAKVVLGFPVPNTTVRGAFKYEAFSGTPLGVEGEYITRDAEKYQYNVSAEYVAGYLIHETGEFVHNPVYWENAANQSLPQLD